MLSFSGSLKVFVAVEPCDMRRSFDSLHNSVSSLLGEDPKSGALFAFIKLRRWEAHSPSDLTKKLMPTLKPRFHGLLQE
jgi:transposase